MTATTERPDMTCPAWCANQDQPLHDPTNCGDLCISYSPEITLSLEPEYDASGGYPDEPVDMRPAYIVAYLVDAHNGTPAGINLERQDKDLAEMTIDEAEQLAAQITALVAAARAEVRS